MSVYSLILFGVFQASLSLLTVLSGFFSTSLTDSFSGFSVVGPTGVHFRTSQFPQRLGFGSFSISHRAKRIGVDPRTGKKIDIVAKITPKFSAGNSLKSAINSKLVQQ